MRSFVVGTAGHVDHGKTTLVRALTGVSTDRLPEEQRRGISIELGFAPLDLGSDEHVSIVDVPGHRRFVPTMIAGASGFELVVLVVAADEGVMPQTREHVAVCELLDLRRGVVALTKIDRVDAETRALAEAEVRELLAGRIDAEVVHCDAVRGIGIDALRAAISSRLRAARARGSGAAPRLWVDRVFHARGAGTVLTGTLVAGVVRRGDTLALATRHGVREVVAKRLHVHGHAVACAEAATRLAINVAIDAREVARGDLVTSIERAPPPTSCLDATFRGAGLPRGARVTVHVGTSKVSAEVSRIEKLDDRDHLVRFLLGEPRPATGGDRLLVRGSAVDARSGALLGGGIVIDAQPAPRARAAARRTLAEAIVSADAGRVLSVLLDRASPHAVDPAAPALAIAAEALVAAVERGVTSGVLVRCGPRIVQRSSVSRLADLARSLVLEHTTAAPLDRGLPLATLKQQLAAVAGDDVAEAAILAARGQRGPDDLAAIAIDGDVAILAARRSAALPRALAQLLERARTVVRESGVHGATIARVAERVGATGDQTRTLLVALEREGTAVRTADLWFDRSLVAKLEERALQHLREGGDLTVIAFKNLGGVPRRQAILLLEHFDAAGVTRRVGNARIAAIAPDRSAGSR